MTVGFVMLAHAALDRAAQLARHLACSGCPVVIHVDRRAGEARIRAMGQALSDLDAVRFVTPRRACDPGGWGRVQATIDGAALMLQAFPAVGHVCLVSGACLPLRPVPELAAHLAARRSTDFIESLRIDDAGPTRGSGDRTRLASGRPAPAGRGSRLSGGLAALQRGLGARRAMPAPLVEHTGSPWWCLSRETLANILDDPARRRFDRHFRQVRNPAESYFQSIVRRHATRIESRALTLSKIDAEGGAHVFHDDHLQLLRRSDRFFARRIWPHADRLYESLLSNDPQVTRNGAPSPGRIDRLFAAAAERRQRGRPGLVMQSRFPAPVPGQPRTAEGYSVFQGLDAVVEGFGRWLAAVTDLRIHGHLFAPGRAEFAGRARVWAGGLSDSARLRDHDPCAFLRNLVWSTRGERQIFMHGPGDNQDALGFMAADPNAQISVVTGAWAIALHRRGLPAGAAREEAARLQRIEAAQLEVLRAEGACARLRVWSLADFVESPLEHLQPVLDEIAPRAAQRLTEAPRLADLGGVGRFLQALRNAGLDPWLAGDVPQGEEGDPARPARPRPYLVT